MQHCTELKKISNVGTEPPENSQCSYNNSNNLRSSETLTINYYNVDVVVKN